MIRELDDRLSAPRRAARRRRWGGDRARARPQGGRRRHCSTAGRRSQFVFHRDDLLGDPRLVEEAASAARLAFENERLQAEARAELAELRTSRARLVAASDAERRRLERDLHDGAQQRLVGLTLAMRLMRRSWSATAARRSPRRSQPPTRSCVARSTSYASWHRGSTRRSSPTTDWRAAIEALAERGNGDGATVGTRPTSGSHRPPRTPPTSSSPRLPGWDP